MPLLRKYSSIIIFAFIGLANTLLDIGLFTVLHTAHLNVFTANLISTSAALLLSLVLNNRYTFKERSLTKNRGIFFVFITLVGIWVMQPIIIETILNLHPFSAGTTTTSSLMAKLCATGFTLVWNYVWYNKVVFRTTRPQHA